MATNGVRRRLNSWICWPRVPFNTGFTLEKQEVGRRYLFDRSPQAAHDRRQPMSGAACPGERGSD
jgi:hypothetical protein